MMATDEDALTCDFAETYHVFNLRALPLRLAATLAYGLRDDSRIKMALSGTRVPLDTLLNAVVADHVRLLVWQNTENGHKGTDAPKSLVALLNGADKQDTENVDAFDSGDAFERAFHRINEG